MKKLSRKFILLVVALGIMFMPIGTVKATLQSNPTTHSRKQADYHTNWITKIRNIEKLGESMGLSETLNSDLTAESESNNIDMHFMKSTEYGAIAILSASGYGNQQTLQESEIKTTTGNESGVYFWGDVWEYVAGGYDGYSGVAPRYFDTYTTSQNSARIGDALGTDTTYNPGCSRWHSASNGNWSRNFMRGNGGLFSFRDGYNNWSGSSTYFYGIYCARGVAVSGLGF